MAAPRGIGEEGAANRRRRAAGGQAPSWCPSDPALAGPDAPKAIGPPNRRGRVRVAIASSRVVWREAGYRAAAEEPGNVQKFARGAAELFPGGMMEPGGQIKLPTCEARGPVEARPRLLVPTRGGWLGLEDELHGELEAARAPAAEDGVADTGVRRRRDREKLGRARSKP